MPVQRLSSIQSFINAQTGVNRSGQKDATRRTRARAVSAAKAVGGYAYEITKKNGKKGYVVTKNVQKSSAYAAVS